MPTEKLFIQPTCRQALTTYDEDEGGGEKAISILGWLDKWIALPRPLSPFYLY